MTQDEKAGVVAELQERFDKASVTLVTTNRGLSVEQATRLRRRLRAVGGEYKVAKHTLTRRALAATRYGRLETLLAGPRALVFGYADPVAVAKALVDFAAGNEKLQIEGGALEGQVLAADQVKALATMPSVGELRARVLRQVHHPAQRLATMVSGPASRIAGAIAAVVDKREPAGG